MFVLKFYLVLFLCFISGCAAIVGGDVSGVEYSYKKHNLPTCSKVNKKYQLKISSNAGISNKSNELAAAISGLSLWIIPMYWNIDADSKYQIFDGDAIVYQNEYENKIHMVYGIPLVPFIFLSGNNKVDYQIWSNTFPLRDAIESRTLVNALIDIPSYIDKKDICRRR